jgi:hypothetical protein
MFLLKTACGLYEFREGYGHLGTSQERSQCEPFAPLFGLPIQFPSFVRVVGAAEQEMLYCFGSVAACWASSAVCSANMVEVLVYWGVREPELRDAA